MLKLKFEVQGGVTVTVGSLIGDAYPTIEMFHPGFSAVDPELVIRDTLRMVELAGFETQYSKKSNQVYIKVPNVDGKVNWVSMRPADVSLVSLHILGPDGLKDVFDGITDRIGIVRRGGTAFLHLFEAMTENKEFTDELLKSVRDELTRLRKEQLRAAKDAEKGTDEPCPMIV